MGLITKEVEVGLSGKNIKHFEELGYEIPRSVGSKGKLIVKKGTKIIVKVDDLEDGSGVFVDVECDGCEKKVIHIMWKDYLKNSHDGKYYCKSCAHNLYGTKNYQKARIKNGKSFYQWCYDNLSKEVADYILSRWDYEKNGMNPKEVSYGSLGLNKKGYWFKCLEHPEHESEQKHITSMTSGRSISLIGSLNCNQCNTIYITHPHLIKYLVNQEDAYKYSFGSEIKILMKCPDCSYEKERSISALINQGFNCNRCNDGISYPNKFLFNVFEQLLNKEFVPELSKTTFKWCKNYRYDFYINKINGICECHGSQHYYEWNNNWQSLKEIQQNDKDKEELAKANDITNYIIIDCRKSSLEWIKNSIMGSDLPSLLNFKESDIDWLKCHGYACSNKVKEACDLWNSGMKSVQKIMKELKMKDSAIIRYLKQGTKLGWCIPPYDPIKAMYVLRKQVICLTTGELFDSITDASRKYGIHETSISQCCKYKNYRTAGKNPVNGDKLVWMFYSEYITKTKEEIKNIINEAQERTPTLFVKVICLTTGEIFNSQVEAEKKYNVKASNISRCCIGKQKSAGKHPVTNEKLIWMYYNEYIKKDKSEIERIYNKNKEKPNYKTQKIICLTTREIFNSIQEAQNKYNIDHISNACQGKSKYAGIHPKTGEKLIWMYYKDYILKTKSEIEIFLIEAKLNYRCVTNKVKCLTTNEIFNSTLDASEKYNISQSGIYKCCRNKQKSCGKHPITGERMTWGYIQE